MRDLTLNDDDDDDDDGDNEHSKRREKKKQKKMSVPRASTVVGLRRGFECAVVGCPPRACGGGQLYPGTLAAGYVLARRVVGELYE